MPRPRTVREPCDCLDCADAPAPPTTVALAIARQEPPPKSLIIVLHDAISSGDAAQAASSDCPHVTALVRDGCTGLLAFAPSSDTGVLVAATNLLGLDAWAAQGPTLGERFKGLQAAVWTDTPAVGELFTSAGAVPVEVLCSGRAIKPDEGQLPWPQPAELATRIAQQLGLPFVRLPGATQAAPGLAALEAPMPGSAPAQQAQQPAAAAQGAAPAAEDAEDTDDDVDMLLLLLDASAAALGEAAAAGAAGAGSGSGSGEGATQQQQQQQEEEEEEQQQACGGAAAEPSFQDSPSPLVWLDCLLQRLNRVEGFRETVLLTVVLGAGRGLASSITGLLEQGEQGPLLGPAATQQQQQQQHGGGGDHSAEACSQGQALPGRPLFRRPLQSYQFRGMERVGIHPEMAALVAHRLPGVIRRDVVELLDVGQVQRRGGGGCILAERMLPEVAYKLGRAPKYGA